MEAPVERASEINEASAPCLYRLTPAQYEAMSRAGILTSDDHVELLEGLLVAKMTKHPPHASATRRTRRLLADAVREGWLVLSQDPITTDESAPEPDVAVVRGAEADFEQRHPSAAEVALVVEVADTSLQQDRTSKQRIYARAAIAVYWIVNLVDRHVEVYTQPSGPADEPRYLKRRDYRLSATVPLILDGVVAGRIAVRELLL